MDRIDDEWQGLNHSKETQPPHNEEDNDDNRDNGNGDEDDNSDNDDQLAQIRRVCKNQNEQWSIKSWELTK